MSAVEDLRAALGFLAPFGNSSPVPSPKTMAWFPVVGAAMGAVLGKSWVMAGRHWPPFASAALVVIGDCAVTGALHLDGLADAADGLLAHVPSKTRLEIMAGPEVGAFGATAVSLALMSRAATLASIAPSATLLAAFYCNSRSIMVLGSRAMPYARPQGGLATAFLGGPDDGASRSGPGTGRRDEKHVVGAAICGAAAALVLASVVRGPRGALAIATGWAGAAGMLALSRRRLGGFTGDVLGAAGVVAELVGLFVLAKERRAPTRLGTPMKLVTP